MMNNMMNNILFWATSLINFFDFTMLQRRPKHRLHLHFAAFACACGFEKGKVFAVVVVVVDVDLVVTNLVKPPPALCIQTACVRALIMPPAFVLALLTPSAFVPALAIQTGCVPSKLDVLFLPA